MRPNKYRTNHLPTTKQPDTMENRATRDVEEQHPSNEVAATKSRCYFSSEFIAIVVAVLALTFGVLAYTAPWNNGGTASTKEQSSNAAPVASEPAFSAPISTVAALNGTSAPSTLAINETRSPSVGQDETMPPVTSSATTTKGNTSSAVTAPAAGASTTQTNAPTPATAFPTSAPFVVPELQECYTNLTTLALILRAKDPFIRQVYKLCPNTVFEMGYNDASNVCCLDGFAPIYPRRLMTVQCGDDGSSANNCTLRGGTSQLNFSPQASELKTDVIVKGLTFEDALGASIFILGTGGITFDDCIIKVRMLVFRHSRLLAPELLLPNSFCNGCFSLRTESNEHRKYQDC
jgi:hypothetical protein